MSSLIVEVCRIDNIVPIEGADRIVSAQVKGWNCIIGKGQFNEGDLCVFIPPDCILPDELIEKYNLTYLKNGGRTSTIKLKNTISQGLPLPVESGWKLGDNVADKMGIKKWEAPERVDMSAYGGARKTASAKKMNPEFDKYTDIENIKNYNTVFKEGDHVVVTEKIHGSNWRAGKLPIVINKGQPFLYRLAAWFKINVLGKKYEYVYGSHNVQLWAVNNENSYYGEDLWGRIAREYDINTLLDLEDYILYGEVYGKGVQDLTYGLDDVGLVIFDIKYKGKYLPWWKVQNLCWNWGLPTVPELYVGSYHDGILQEFTDGESLLCPTQMREGIVIKSYDEENHPRIGRKILKSVSAIYLTRKGGTEYK